MDRRTVAKLSHADPLEINAQNAERLLGIDPAALGVFFVWTTTTRGVSHML